MLVNFLLNSTSVNAVTISAGPGGTYEDSAASPLNVNCALQFETDGQIWILNSQDPNQQLENWMSPAGGDSVANYEIRATRTAGTNPTAGTLDTWLSLSSNRFWQNTRTVDTPGTVTSTLLIEIRRVSDSVVLSSATYTIQAIVT